MRLGLAIGDVSLRKVRALPYPLYKRWQIYFMLEPWGFPDQEYRTAAVLAQINNSHVQKRSQLQKVDKRMRDMTKGILKHLQNLISKSRQQQAFDLDTEEGKRLASEQIIKNFELMFGKRLVRKDK